MATWLGRSANDDGWRYLHEDGRVEDAPDTMLGGFTPPGFDTPGRSDAAVPSFAADSGTGPPAQPEPPVIEPQPPVIAPPAQPELIDTAPAIAPLGRSTSVSVGKTAATLPGDKAVLPKGSKFDQGVDRMTTDLYAPQQAAGDELIGAVNRGADAQQVLDIHKADALRTSSILARKQQHEHDQEVERMHTDAAAWTDRVAKAVDSVPAMDRTRMFRNENNANGVGAAIAVFMGGFMQPVLGTNKPLDIINAAIDRDIHEQENDQEMAQKNILNIKDLAKASGDENMFMLNQADIKRQAYLSAISKDLEAKGMEYQSTVMREKANELAAQVKGQLAQGWAALKMQVFAGKETQRAHIEQNSIARQTLALQQYEAVGRREAAGRAAAQANAPQRANFLSRDTGIRSSTNPDGYYAPNEKIREAAATKTENANSQIQKIHETRRLLHGNWEILGSEARERAGAAITRNVFDLMSKIQGLGQKEDTVQMKKTFGGDRDAVFNFASKDTAEKVLQDMETAITGDMNSFTKTLQYDNNEKVTYEAPAYVPDALPTEPSPGDGRLVVEKALRENPPTTDLPDHASGKEDAIGHRKSPDQKPRENVVSTNYQDGTASTFAELKRYPGMMETAEGRKEFEKTIKLYSEIPEAARTYFQDNGDGTRSPVDPLPLFIQALVEGENAEKYKNLKREAVKQREDENTKRLNGWSAQDVKLGTR